MPSAQLANWQGKSKPVIIDLDTIATGSAETCSYVCAADPSGHAFIQRILSR
jgi:hypothetical protein